ncbi:MAG: COX15/CtaA family protein [Gemmatimonadetes bacterium]|nr:COX15/CtaA family protein [Gemmatimonadota bacterium]MDA1102531.1 COX15/CtaA family protein [Gemmatimonadota bacterium]
MLHPRAFKVTVVWTLFLLYVGSVVHATESSLACPDWPTCFGTMVPEMTGGVFWEHLHRLIAGGLVLMFMLATWLARKETQHRPWILRACVAGLVLLVVQSVFGGLTVIYQLPDMVSTTHLSLAFVFLALATVLAAATAQPAASGEDFGPGVGRRLSILAAIGAGVVFLQSALGALVRHTEAGMACPDIPLCLGRVVPPLVNLQITAHFTHRVLAIITLLLVLYLVGWAYRAEVPASLRKRLAAAAFLVVAQVVLGVASVLMVLAVAPVSLHTLFAAALLSVLVWIATVSRQER